MARLHLWTGHTLQTPGERDALAQIATALQQPGGVQDDVHLAYGFKLNNVEIDFCALGSGGALIGEYKNWAGRIVPRENGPWYQVLQDGSTLCHQGRENPYHQCARQRSRLNSRLAEWSASWQRSGHGPAERLPTDAPGWGRWIQAGVVLPRGVNIGDGRLADPWWYIETLPEWIGRVAAFSQARRRLGGFSPEAFVESLHLERVMPATRTAPTPRPARPEPRPDAPAVIDPEQVRDAEQREAVTAPVDRHLLVVAGPGAGKTRVLIERARHLMAAGCATDRLALITYTNSARHEIKGRLEQVASVDGGDAHEEARRFARAMRAR